MIPSGPQIHERHFIVADAQNAIAKLLLDVEKKYDLTYAEMVGILAGQLAAMTKYAIREERHGDASKPGDVASEDHEP
jgi:hypothetical protein